MWYCGGGINLGGSTSGQHTNHSSNHIKSGTLIIVNDNMKTQLQLEYELQDTRQSLEVALEELDHWKKSLKIIGETPEEVYESWRTRQIKMFKYIRIMSAWRSKYNFLCEKYLQNIRD